MYPLVEIGLTDLPKSGTPRDDRPARRLDVENLKNESFPNRTIYSSFPSVEASDFKNAIYNNIHWAAFEAAEV